MGFAEDRDLDTINAQLAKWIAGRLDLDEEATRVEELDFPEESGFSSETVLFDLVTNQGGSEQKQQLVARLEPTEFHVFPDYDLPLQYRVLETLSATPVPVPKVRWLETSGDILGVPFFVMDRVEGRVPSDSPPMHMDGWVAEELSESERATLWWSGLDAMCEVHKLDWKALRLNWLLDRTAGATPIEQQLNYYQDFFSWGMKRERHPLIESALDYLQTRQPTDEPIALCWGDSRMGNQIYNGTKCAAVIDWEMVRLGNPVQDLTWWLATERCFTEGIEVDRLPGFPSTEDTVAHWEAKTGFSAKDIDYYVVLALTKFSVIMARVAERMKQLEMIEPENEFDVENLASITLERVLKERT